jgi:hypothetical protein
MDAMPCVEGHGGYGEAGISVAECASDFAQTD